MIKLTNNYNFGCHCLKRYVLFNTLVIDHGRADIQALHHALNRSGHQMKNRDFFQFLKQVKFAGGSHVTRDQSERLLYSRLCFGY